jgi:hypothetical protein
MLNASLGLSARLRWLFLLLNLLISISVAGTKRTLSTVSTISEAQESADNYTGFSRFADGAALSTQASSLVFTDSTTPFLHDSLNGRKAWRVQYTVFNPSSKSRSGQLALSSQLIAQVWIDSLTGQLLQVVISPISHPEVGYRMPTPVESEKQLAAFTEKYLGLPNELPTLSLSDCLAKIGWAKISQDCGIIANYVLYTNEQKKMCPTGTRMIPFWELPVPFPAWVIYRRGTPESKLPGKPTQSIVEGTICRRVFDAQSGVASPETNFPYPDLDTIHR